MWRNETGYRQSSYFPSPVGFEKDGPAGGCSQKNSAQHSAPTREGKFIGRLFIVWMLSAESLILLQSFAAEWIDGCLFVCWKSFVEFQARAGHVEQLSMGSLMAGWDKDPWTEQRALTRSTTSLTKEEIQDFWRKRQLDMEEHLKAAKAQKSDSQSETGVGTPSIDIPKAIMEDLEEQLPESMSPDWWTRSNSAFLNSPPESSGKHSKYTAQYEVAKRATQAT